jgi:beta-phosphoglucomutase
MFEAVIFDLDGVIVDTAKYHFIAWRRLANSLGIDFTEDENENLKGVSRIQSLEYILKLGGLDFSTEIKSGLAAKKNEWYVESISQLDKNEILPGVESFINDLKNNHVKIALGSASKNSIPILKSISLLHLFDYISDGNSTDKSKPDPEVFLIAAKGLNVQPAKSLVIEDSISGVDAAIAGGFASLGIGLPDVLIRADRVVQSLDSMSYDSLIKLYSK